MEERIRKLEDTVGETHTMVKSMYAIVLGQKDYKVGSLVAEIGELKEQVEELTIDKIKRDATTKVIAVISGSVGGILVAVISYFLKK